jgi:fatty-acyl-CoA synthase
MHGLMQDWPLTVDRIIDHAARVHGRREIVTRRTDGTIHRTNYAMLRRRARQVSGALANLGIARGDRVWGLLCVRHRRCVAYGT